MTGCDPISSEAPPALYVDANFAVRVLEPVAPHAVISHVAQAPELHEPVPEVDSSAPDDLHQILTSVNCLIWYGSVRHVDEQTLDWSLHVPNEEAAMRFFPVRRKPGQRYWDAWHDSRPAEDQARIAVFGAEHIRACRGYRQEFRCSRSDGELRWIGEDVHVRLVEPGHWRAVGVCIDITDTKRAETAASEYAAIIMASQEAILAGGLDGVITTWNPGAERLFGHTSKFAIGQSVEIVFPLTARGRVHELLEDVSRGRTVPPFELHCIDNVGRGVDVALSFAPLRDAADRVIGWAALLRDVSERLRAREALRESQALYRSLVDTLPASIYRKDRVGRFTFANDRFAESLGVSPEEVLGKNDYDFAPAELADQYVRDDQKVMDGGESLDISEEYLTASGTMRYIHVMKTPVRDWNGAIIGTQGIFWDVTDRVEAEHALARRTEDLARSNQELEQFAYIASHDLQEPLRMVANYVQLLERRYKGRLDADADDFIAYAVGGAVRMQALIKDILTYSRVGTRRRSPVHVDVSCAIRTAIENLAATVTESGARITVGDMPELITDGSQLVQLFQNLIGNAIKFRSDLPPEVSIRCARLDDVWEFSVSDNGIGIESQYATKVFEIFERLHSSSHYAGTGIGLAICKKIVERNGGRIWIDCDRGSGATFRFTLQG